MSNFIQKIVREELEKHLKEKRNPEGHGMYTRKPRHDEPGGSEWGFEDDPKPSDMEKDGKTLKKPSVKEVSLGTKIKAYKDRSDMESDDYYDGSKDGQSDKTLNHIKNRHGDKAADHAVRAAKTSWAGRKAIDPNNLGKSNRDPLFKGPDPASKKVTKTGKMSKTYTNSMKNDLKNRQANRTRTNNSSIDESEASEEAKKMKLKHLGYGMYAGKDGKVSHRSVDGKLVPVTDQGGRDAVVKAKDTSDKKEFGGVTFSKGKEKELLKALYGHLNTGRKVTIQPNNAGYELFFEPEGVGFGADMKIGAKEAVVAPRNPVKPNFSDDEKSQIQRDMDKRKAARDAELDLVRKQMSPKKKKIEKPYDFAKRVDPKV